MQRVLVMGSSGSGKSTFARRLSEMTGIPFVSLDALYWKPGWVASDNAEFGQRVAEIARQPRWVMDGNFTSHGAGELRRQASDTVIWFDLPRRSCMLGIMKRIGGRPDNEGMRATVKLLGCTVLFTAVYTAAGVVVGRVQEMHFDSDRYQASVTLALDKRFPFPKDTTASILTSGLLGEVYIGLDAGGDPKMLADKGVIMKTQSAMVLEKLIGQFLYNKAAEGGSK